MPTEPMNTTSASQNTMRQKHPRFFFFFLVSVFAAVADEASPFDIDLCYLSGGPRGQPS